MDISNIFDIEPFSLIKNDKAKLLNSHLFGLTKTSLQKL